MIIGISGGTGSGKTTVANRILESVSASEVVFIQQDSYYRNLTDLPLDYRGVANFDHPTRSTTNYCSITCAGSNPVSPSTCRSTIQN
jgi:uridine kinase